MERDKINTSSNCKMNYKCTLTTVAIILLIAGSIYLLIRHNNQNEIIKTQASYINELRANLTQNNSAYDIDRYFNRLFDNTWLSFRRPLDDVEDIVSRSWNIKSSNQEAESYYSYISINTKDNEYVITMVLPGFSKEEIAIELSSNILKVNAKGTNINQNRNERYNTNDEKQQTSELKQSIRVPNDIDQDNISATLNNGLLTITLPRIHDKTSKEAKKILIH